MTSKDDMREGDDATMMWYNELNDPGYDYNRPGFGPAGHFTQVVWKECTHVGFGISGGWVCGRYSPAGNVMGAFPENVLPLVDGWEDMKAADDVVKAEKAVVSKAIK